MIISRALSVFIVLLSVAPQKFCFRTWKCFDRKCVKEFSKSSDEVISIEECKARCLEFGGLWPKPTGSFHMGNRTSRVDTTTINFEKNELPKTIDSLLKRAQKRFLAQIIRLDDMVDLSSVASVHRVNVKFKIYDLKTDRFSTGTDESYRLSVFPPIFSEAVRVEIEASTFFGVRHGLETLSQLFFYDDIHKSYKMMDDVFIEDKPQFTHRGVTLDTARSYVTVGNIMKILDAMAVNKLNTFHWHITDSQSFPYVSLNYPEMSVTGAYSESQVYSQEDIENLVEEARGLGIRIVPEFDAPAHVGEGWPALGNDLITCFKWEPWRDYCVEPPCGQLDPTNERVYSILGTIYKEYVNLFQSDLFHMGGDEVNINCWRSTPRIQKWMQEMNHSSTNEDYHNLWGNYQIKALKKLKETKSDHPPEAILWTSTLTQPEIIDRHLSPKDYILQVWTSKTDPAIGSFLEKGFRIIFSNYDELYFDCGGASWVGSPGQNWCSPFIGWQKVYSHSPYTIVENQRVNINETTRKLILGSESALWTEQLEGSSLHVRLWPRAAALAERLWSNPKNDWRAAQFRMNHHRQRMARRIAAELLQPEWCYQNDGFCD